MVPIGYHEREHDVINHKFPEACGCRVGCCGWFCIHGKGLKSCSPEKFSLVFGDSGDFDVGLSTFLFY